MRDTLYGAFRFSASRADIGPTELIRCSTGARLGNCGRKELLPVIDWSAAALLLFTLGMTEAGPAPVPTQYAELVVRDRVILRIPVRFRRPPTPVHWRESRGPKCLPARDIAGAALAGRDRVDLILRDERRVRAELEESCPALDYYYGFYISPNPDGKVCADRDVIRSRVGGQCGIERFRALTARVRR